MWPGREVVSLSACHRMSCWGHTPTVSFSQKHTPVPAAEGSSPGAASCWGRYERAGEEEGPASQPSVQGIRVRSWLGELMVCVCVCASPDVCARGAVHRGHRGVGTTDVPRAGDPGTALHFPGGLSVLRWRPAVRPAGGAAQSLAWPGLDPGPVESGGDKIHPACW